MMYGKASLTVLALIVIAGFAACAQTKKAGKNKSGGSYARVIDATSQRYVPGLPEAQPTTNYRFILKWNSATPPEAFYWRGPDNWMSCAISKVTRIPRNGGQAGELPYKTLTTPVSNIKKGDTVQIMTITGAKDPTPETLPSNAINTLFFRTNNTGWLSLPVKNIRALPKITGQ